MNCYNAFMVMFVKIICIVTLLPKCLQLLLSLYITVLHSQNKSLPYACTGEGNNCIMRGFVRKPVFNSIINL